MYKYYNPNPRGKNVGDCTVRAVSKALNQNWEQAFAGLTATGFMLCDMPSSNNVWGEYLRRNGFTRELIDRYEYTIEDFCTDHKKGLYVLALNNHVVCVQDGDYYDSWDSGKEIPLYVWRREYE